MVGKIGTGCFEIHEELVDTKKAMPAILMDRHGFLILPNLGRTIRGCRIAVHPGFAPPPKGSSTRSDQYMPSPMGGAAGPVFFSGFSAIMAPVLSIFQSDKVEIIYKTKFKATNKSRVKKVSIY